MRQAEAITLSGQLAIQWIAKFLNEYLNAVCGSVDEDYVIYIDTDSVVGSSMLDVVYNRMPMKMSIEDLWDMVNSNKMKEGTIPVNNFKSLSMNKKEQLEYRDITYVMKHKVEKEMFRITDEEGNSVEVTEDHSVIINREGDILSVSAKDIVDGDEIYYIPKN